MCLPRFPSSTVFVDPNGLFGLLRHFPYQADTLLQLSEVYFHREGMLSCLILVSSSLCAE